MEPFHPEARNFVTINRVFEAANGEDLVILACTVLIQYSSVTDGQTPRPWLRRAKHSAIARKNSIRSTYFIRQPHRFNMFDHKINYILPIGPNNYYVLYGPTGGFRGGLLMVRL